MVINLRTRPCKKNTAELVRAMVTIERFMKKPESLDEWMERIEKRFNWRSALIDYIAEKYYFKHFKGVEIIGITGLLTR